MLRPLTIAFFSVFLSTALWSQGARAASRGVISHIAVLRSIIHVDLVGRDRAPFRVNQKVMVITGPSRTKKSGKVKMVLGRRLIIEIRGGMSGILRGARARVKAIRKSTSSVGSWGVVRRSHPKFKNRMNFSVLGEVALYPGDSTLMYGGGIGVTLFDTIEVEGFYTVGDLAVKGAALSGQLIHANVKYFFSNYIYALAGGGYRTSDITAVAEKTDDKTPTETPEVVPTEEPDSASLGYAKANFSEDLIAEAGAGVRWRIKTVAVGSGFIVGFEGGYEFLITILGQTEIPNPVLEKKLPLPAGRLFTRAHVGFTF